MGAVKHLTRSQLESCKEKAVRFTRDVLGDPDRADEIAPESLEGYAARRKIQITNPSRRKNAIMATTKSKTELEAENADLREENRELQSQLDSIADIVAPEDADDDDDQTKMAMPMRRRRTTTIRTECSPAVWAGMAEGTRQDR
jgi:hypothetical protein